MNDIDRQAEYLYSTFGKDISTPEILQYLQFEVDAQIKNLEELRSDKDDMLKRAKDIKITITNRYGR